MTADPHQIQELQRAKEALREQYGRRAWFRGVGLAPSDAGLILRLNVDPAVKVDPAEIPHEFRGHPVDVVYIGAYKPRRDQPAS